MVSVFQAIVNDQDSSPKYRKLHPLSDILDTSKCGCGKIVSHIVRQENPEYKHHHVGRFHKSFMGKIRQATVEVRQQAAEVVSRTWLWPLS